MSATIVRAFQTLKGLGVDGIVGPLTMSAAEDVLRAAGDDRLGDKTIPRNRRALEANPAYGKPSYVRGRGRLVDLDDAWVQANIRTFTLHTGQRRRLHRLAGNEFAHLFKQACAVSGYTPKSVQTFVTRVIGGTDRLSYHAYGLAVDFDPRHNAMGARNLINPGQPTLLRQHPEFMEVFKAAGWTWGGDWKMQDDMHAQRVA